MDTHFVESILENWKKSKNPMPNHNFLKQTKNPLPLILFPSKATLTFIF